MTPTDNPLTALPSKGEITCLFEQADQGDSSAFEEIVRLVYPELERVAEQKLRAHYGQKAQHLTLEPASLVNETLLKLIDKPRSFENRRHFYSFVMKVMTRVMFDYQRAKNAEKRGGNQVHVTLNEVGGKTPTFVVWADYNSALERLAALDERKAEIVKLRAYFGLELVEIADTVGVSLRTVERDLRFSRRWLAVDLGVGDSVLL